MNMKMKINGKREKDTPLLITRNINKGSKIPITRHMIVIRRRLLFGFRRRFPSLAQAAAATTPPSQAIRENLQDGCYLLYDSLLEISVFCN